MCVWVGVGWGVGGVVCGVVGVGEVRVVCVVVWGCVGVEVGVGLVFFWQEGEYGRLRGVVGSGWGIGGGCGCGYVTQARKGLVISFTCE